MVWVTPWSSMSAVLSLLVWERTLYIFIHAVASLVACRCNFISVFIFIFFTFFLDIFLFLCMPWKAGYFQAFWTRCLVSFRVYIDHRLGLNFNFVLSCDTHNHHTFNYIQHLVESLTISMTSSDVVTWCFSPVCIVGEMWKWYQMLITAHSLCNLSLYLQYFTDHHISTRLMSWYYQLF